MNNTVKVSSLYQENVNSNLEIDFNSLIKNFGKKNNEVGSDAFLSGIKQISAQSHFEDLKTLLENADSNLYDIEITEIK